MNVHIKPNVAEVAELRAVHVGVSGFPFGSASINKCIAVYQSLHQHKINFLIINNRAIHRKNVPVPIERSGFINNLRYVYTCISPYKSDSFFMKTTKMGIYRA